MTMLRVGEVYRYARPYDAAQFEVAGLPNVFFRTKTPGTTKATLESGITGASLVSANVYNSGFDASDVSFTSSSVILDLNGTDWRQGNQILISIDECRPFPGGGATEGCFPGLPEPGTLALLGLGLAGLAFTRRRKR